MATAIEFENVGKQYRLGLVSTQTLSHDLNRWWQMNVLHKEDPYLRIGETNDRTVKGHSDYVWALKDINFKVEQGDVVGIIGRNGAGKSTLLKLLSKVTGPSTGIIRARGRIGSLLEVGTGFHPEMTGRENIYMNGAILGMSKAEITRKLDEIVDFSGCERYLDTPVKRYSSGMMVRLGFAVAAHLDPEILVVDEVLAVGDAEFQKKAIGKMKDVSQGEGRTVLFVSHNMDSILNLCKSGIILEKGVVRCYSSDIHRIVNEYLCAGNNQSFYMSSENKRGVFVQECYFLGNQNQQIGSFFFNEAIHLKTVVIRKTDYKIANNCILSIGLFTSQEHKLCTIEYGLSDLNQGASKVFDIQLPNSLFSPGDYYFSFTIHIPNYELIEDIPQTCHFTISDTGTDYLKYNGAPTGDIIIRPRADIIIK